MQIRTRFSISADGYVTTPDGWPALSTETALELESQRSLPGGSVEIVYACS
jgi:hypothetical protein